MRKTQTGKGTSIQSFLNISIFLLYFISSITLSNTTCTDELLLPKKWYDKDQTYTTRSQWRFSEKRDHTRPVSVTLRQQIRKENSIYAKLKVSLPLYAFYWSKGNPIKRWTLSTCDLQVDKAQRRPSWGLHSADSNCELANWRRHKTAAAKRLLLGPSTNRLQNLPCPAHILKDK